MRKSVALGVLILVFAGLAAGAYYVAFPGGRLAKPEVREVWHEWGVVNATTTEVISHVVIYNPSRAGLTVLELAYTIYLNDIEFATGRLQEPVQVPAQGEAELVLRTYLDNTKIPAWWASHVQNGERTVVRAEGRTRVRTFGITFTVPFSIPAREAETDLDECLDLENVTIDLAKVPFLGTDIELYVEEVDTSWGVVNATITELLHHAVIRNTYDVPVLVPDMTIEYEIWVNDVLLGGGTVPVAHKLVPPGDTYELDFSTVIDNSLLDDVWVSHLQHGEDSTVLVKVFVVGNGGRVLVHEESRELQTDILSALAYSSSS